MNLGFWLPAMFLLGIGAMGLCYLKRTPRRRGLVSRVKSSLTCLKSILNFAGATERHNPPIEEKSFRGGKIRWQTDY
jgi:hypothetical protein